MNTTARHEQRGVALITALLAVAIASLLAVELTTRVHQDVRRTQNLLARDQAYAYALSVEQWALAMLIEDRRERGPVDHPGEPWAREITPPPFEGARMRLRMEDLQGRFNLNTLVTAQGADAPAEQDRFSRLLMQHDIDPTVTTAAADWIDPRPEIRFPAGAGDDWYSRETPPYRAANRPMASASELRLVRGIDDPAWRRIRDAVTALPEATPINVNTAPPAVLRSLADGLSRSDAESLAEARPEDGWQRVEDFLAHPALAGSGLEPAGLDVGSRYFLLRTEVQLGRLTLRTESVLHRPDGGGGDIILRRQGFFD